MDRVLSQMVANSASGVGHLSYKSLHQLISE